MPIDGAKDQNRVGSGLLTRGIQKNRETLQSTSSQSLTVAVPATPRSSAQSNSSPGPRSAGLLGAHAWPIVASSSNISPRVSKTSILNQSETPPDIPSDRTSAECNRQSPSFPTAKSPLPTFSRSGSASGSGSLRLQASNPGTLTALIRRLSSPKPGHQVARASEPISPFIHSSKPPDASPPLRLQPAVGRAASHSALLPTPPAFTATGTMSLNRRNRISSSSGSGNTFSLTAEPTAITPTTTSTVTQILESPPRPLTHRDTVLEDEPFIIASEQSMPQLSASHDYSDLYDPDVGPDQVHHRAIPGFLIGREIGDGGFGAVRIGCFLSTNERIAVKVVDKKRLEDPDDDMLLKREIRAMKHVNGHPGIIKLHGSFETDSYVYLVMDYLKGGTLLDYVKKKKNLPKTDAARLLSQAAEALKHCHGLALIHRDIKLENMMLDADDNLKLIDFGLCAFFRPGQRLKVFCGSPSYAAPEIVNENEYEGPPVDVWSLGVCFYAMVVGYLPFYNSRGKKNLDEKIVAGEYNLPDYIQQSSVKSLIEGMLTVDPSKRMTLDEVLAHPWLKTYSEKKSDSALSRSG